MSTESLVEAVAALGGRGDGEGVATRLLDRWREPHRGYHDERHLREVLAAIDELAAAGSLRCDEPPPAGSLRCDELCEEPRRAHATLAAWFHDAVYDGRPGEDEEASARLAESELSPLLDEGDVAAVADLVRSTAAHALPGDRGAEALIHDADLWILGAPEARFDEYCAQVRSEYAHVPDEDFRRGRAAVLTPFVQRRRLYATAYAHDRWTGPARANLARELERLVC